MYPLPTTIAMPSGQQGPGQPWSLREKHPAWVRKGNMGLGSGTVCRRLKFCRALGWGRIWGGTVALPVSGNSGCCYRVLRVFSNHCRDLSITVALPSDHTGAFWASQERCSRVSRGLLQKVTLRVTACAQRKPGRNGSNRKLGATRGRKYRSS